MACVIRFLTYSVLFALTVGFQRAHILSNGYFALTLLCSAGVFFLAVLFRNGLLEHLKAGIGMTIFFVIGLALLPIVFVPIGLLWALYNVVETAKTVWSLKWKVVFSILIWACLYWSDPVTSGGAPGSDVEWLAQGILCVALLGYAFRLSRAPMVVGLFDLSMTTVSMPLSALLIVLAAQALRAAFTVRVDLVTRPGMRMQSVSGYMRGATAVAGYTRAVPGSVTQAVTSATVGSGAVSAGLSTGLLVGHNNDSKDQ